MINTKKVNAVILALVIALSACIPAFAYYKTVGSTTYFICDTCGFLASTAAEMNTHKEAYPAHVFTMTEETTTTTTSSSSDSSSGYTAYYYDCPECEQKFRTIEDLNEHLESAHSNNAINTHYDTYVGLTIPQIIDTLFGYFQTLYSYFVDTGFNDIMYSNASTFFESLTTYIIQIAGLAGDSATTAA